jgi:hypothetical protein
MDADVDVDSGELKTQLQVGSHTDEVGKYDDHDEEHIAAHTEEHIAVHDYKGKKSLCMTDQTLSPRRNTRLATKSAIQIYYSRPKRRSRGDRVRML